MAEHEQRVPRSANRGEPAPARGGRRHEALQRRTTAREAGYGTLLNSRPPGPRPIQRRIVSSLNRIDGSKAMAARAGAAASPPMQMAWHYGNHNTLQNDRGSAHWHYGYDDADETSLHLTLADVRSYNPRDWASRRSYTPTGVDTGNWSGWVNNHGNTPGWATELAGNGGTGTAEDAFHADQAIGALLLREFQVQPDLADEEAFPALGQQPAQQPAQVQEQEPEQEPEPEPEQEQVQEQPAEEEPQVQAPAPRPLNPNALAFVPRRQ